MKILLSIVLFATMLFADYKNIDPQTLQELKNKGVKVIDVRTHDEWIESGVIPNSILITSHSWQGFNYDAFKKELKAKGINDNFVLVCRSGNRSREVAERLNADGYKNFYNLQGGIKVWIYEKKPTVKPAI